MADEDVELVEDWSNAIKPRKVKVSASIKGWVAMAAAILSIGFSVGLWAASGAATNAQLKDIQIKLEAMPSPQNVANKEVVDIQLKTVNDTLVRIESALKDVAKELKDHAKGR